MNWFKSQRIYLDYAASTPIDPAVGRLLTRLSAELVGNASALHKEGLQAKLVLQNARERVAHVFSVRAKEIVFTGSGTESDALALVGVVRAFKKDNPTTTAHIITSIIEHSAILETCRHLEREGVNVTYLKPDSHGLIDPKQIKDALTPETILVSIAYANNEIGTIAPIRDIAKVIRQYKSGTNSSHYPLVHTDAMQAVNYLPVKMDALGVDLFSCNSAKLYGPKGVGMLYIKDGTPIEPLYYGGSQEHGLRPGTENVPLIAAFAEALAITRTCCEHESTRLAKLRDGMINRIRKEIPEAIINGDLALRLPNNVNITIPGVPGDVLVLGLDAEGIAVSSRSACTSEEEGESYVIMALREESNSIDGSIRFSLGRSTRQSDIDATITALKHVLKRATYGR